MTMNINAHIIVLDSLKNLLKNLTNESFSKKNDLLFGASIGEHFRHIIEFYLCVMNQDTQEVINYDLRKRDRILETKVTEGILVIDRILTKLGKLKEQDNIPIKIETCLDENQSNQGVSSSLFRELMYCMDHCIHHQSLIKIGLLEQKLSHMVDANFGVAFSTQQYRNQCVS